VGRVVVDRGLEGKVKRYIFGHVSDSLDIRLYTCLVPRQMRMRVGFISMCIGISEVMIVLPRFGWSPMEV
jgi:hypothetical protein